MLTALWSGLGGKTADRWASLLTSPAMVFWLGGAFAWAWSHSHTTRPGADWQALGHGWSRGFGGMPTVVQAVSVLLALLLVVGSARLVDALTFAVLRLLEGYWPGWAWPVRAALTSVRGRAIERRAVRWRQLAGRRAELTDAEYAEFAALNAARAAVPPAPRDRMPTRLGDVLKAAESRPRHRYGLDAVVCWPHLWLTMPEQTRAEVCAARARLDEGARLWLWSLLFCLWTVFTWWALGIALLGMAVGYRLALSAATQYGTLVQACFDLYRGSLYEQLGWDLPADSGLEWETGQRLTAHLERGPLMERTAGRPE
ncbi:hypothetical protein ACFOSC_13055 [Streptantibioticus rubrisoli]|uniref:DUF4129 domain-containing protein n=1 Tax=Streptantibioticus rubrisoli TaxID=1387313 RepID=A0ABT1P7U1_9ACTN|nr:hypothetical protein [Streptantibioticus rubrisoli]MCQ4041441.1 hypothetical protein [Streptantibioticus rubrisoli]